MDVQGLVKSTAARGEDEFPSGLLRVSDCHDSVIYALAPLQFASIYCCSDCTVVRPQPSRSELSRDPMVFLLQRLQGSPAA